MVCKEIMRSKWFEHLCITVIITNSVTMMLDNSPANDPNQFYVTVELVFLWFYTSEMVVKIGGMGFFFSEKAYIKDSWNILDFFIVTTSLINQFTPKEAEGEGGGFSL